VKHLFKMNLIACLLQVKAEEVGQSKSQGTEQKKPCCGGKKKSKAVKPQELPIYGNPNPPQDIILREEGLIERQVREARLAAASNFAFLGEWADRTIQFVDTGVAHTQSTMHWAANEASTPAKAGVIVGTGLVGMLLASRRGIFKKLLYTSLGVAGGASICYPNEAKESVDIGLYIAKNKGPQLIKSYTGIDLNQGLAKSLLATVGTKSDSKTSSKPSPPTESVTQSPPQEDSRNALNRSSPAKDNNPKAQAIVAKTSKEAEKASKSKAPIGDLGQSNPADADLYSTRSS